jgi:hypothetical protein
MVPACNLPWQPGPKTVVATVPHMRSSAVVQPTSQPYVGKTLTIQSTTREAEDKGLLGSSKTPVMEECHLPMYHGGT